MNDLISRNALLDAMPKNDELLSFDVRRVICNAPAVDAAPKVYGRWEFDAFTAKHGNPYRCSICKEEYDNTHNYCPNCGADMVGGTEDEQ